MIDKLLVVLQCFFLCICAFVLLIIPIINGIIEKWHSKAKKNWIWIIGLVLSFSLMSLLVWSIALADKDNSIIWYIFTLVSIVITSLILFEIDNNSKHIDNPSKLKEYINNARYEIVKDGLMDSASICKILIYLYYIILMVLNQVGTLSENIFSNSLYLKINEYSLIIFFAIEEMVKIIPEIKQGKKK